MPVRIATEGFAKKFNFNILSNCFPISDKYLWAAMKQSVIRRI